MTTKHKPISRLFGLTFALLATLFTFCYVFMSFTMNSVSAERNYGESAIVMDKTSGRVLYQKNAYEKKFMASTTKILTAITILEHCDPNAVVTVGSETVGIEGSSIYLEEGEQLSVKDLLYGLMLRSGNDAAETLAVFCSGDIKTFAELMNETANKIGALNSNFVNPHGLHDDNHYTTAYDLALITRYAMNNEIFREIVSCRFKEIPWTTRGYSRRLFNKNKMLSEVNGATGVKTGYTKNAGRCLVSSFLRDGMELICVVLNCPPMFEQSKKLLTDAFAKYKIRELVNADNIIDFIKKDGTEELCGLHIKDNVTLPLTDEEYENVKIVYDYPKELSTTTKKDEEIGSIKIYCRNNLIFSQKIYTLI